MKKLLLTAIAALAFCGSIFAQHLNPNGYETHYAFNEGQYEQEDYPVAHIEINGAIVTQEDNWADLEIASFVGTQIRGHAFLTDEWIEMGWPYPLVELPVCYNTTGEEVSFKVFNHATNQEYDATCNTVIRTGDEHLEIYMWDWDNAVVISYTTGGEETFTKEITGYGDATGKTGYYFIASPIDDVDPTTVDGMTYPEGDDYAKFDLYSFNQVQDDEEWRNYKAESFNLAVGSGYLYANKNNVILSVTGTPAEGPTFGVELTLTDGHAWTGWNLVGNPFGVEAYIDRPCYTLNGENYVEIGEGEPIGIMQGVLVQADEDEEILTFSTTAPGKSANLSLNLTSESKLVDRAIVSFGNGRNLDKLTFRENSSKLYMTQDSKDYAVVYSEGQGEMPVCFKAEKNGSYNISFTAENAEFSYLHLIDNLTGNDVDLLENPSYSFDARTSDYASRFKLVFSAGNANMGNDFGFISNGNLMVLGIEGEATLQVIDVTGRILSSETFSGNYNKAVNEAQGVYMIRLIQGENVRTQKIVIK